MSLLYGKLEVIMPEVPRFSSIQRAHMLRVLGNETTYEKVRVQRRKTHLSASRMISASSDIEPC